MIRVMILTGQSSQYHNWAVSSAMLGQHLEAARSTGSGQAGLFEVTIVTSPPSGADMSSFAPAFALFDVVAMDVPRPARAHSADDLHPVRAAGCTVDHVSERAHGERRRSS
jgi:uncharacterized protein